MNTILLWSILAVVILTSFFFMLFKLWKTTKSDNWKVAFWSFVSLFLLWSVYSLAVQGLYGGWIAIVNKALTPIWLVVFLAVFIAFCIQRNKTKG